MESRVGALLSSDQFDNRAAAGLTAAGRAEIPGAKARRNMVCSFRARHRFPKQD